MSHLKKSIGKLEAISSSPIQIGNIAPGTHANDVVTKSQLDAIGSSSTSSTGSSFVFIGTITKDDVNANIGVASFLLGDFSYNGRILSKIASKTTEAFDSDIVNAGIIDNVTSYSIILSDSGSLTTNTLSIADTSSWQQTTSPASTFSIMAIFGGKGTFAGGNTTGSLNVYALFVDLP